MNPSSFLSTFTLPRALLAAESPFGSQKQNGSIFFSGPHLNQTMIHYWRWIDLHVSRCRFPIARHVSLSFLLFRFLVGGYYIIATLLGILFDLCKRGERVRQRMASWHSSSLEIAYEVLGWVAFFSWSFSFYPQVILNYARKSVVGLNFDFLVLNVTKHSSYLIYNAALYFSPIIQRQYHEEYGYNEMIPVAANDVAFSTHAVLLTAITLFQVLIYERGNQKVSKTCMAITLAVWSVAVVCIIIAWPNRSWLWLISVFNSIQVFMTAIKYIPQAFMNFRRKSTEGWSIGNILLDLLGGLTNFAQMGVQSIDQGTFVNFYGNVGKTLLSLEVVVFDLIFIFQHYVLYGPKRQDSSTIVSEETTTPLVKSCESSQKADV